MIRFACCLLLCAASLSNGCGKSDDAKYSSMGVPTSGSDDDPVYGFSEEDAQMNAAMKMAKETVDTFIEALEKKSRTQTYFAVKKAFRTSENGFEHIWIDSVQFDGAQFHGMVNNEPADVPNLKLGQIVSVPKDGISDWMIVDDGKLVGGYTIRAMRNKMSAKERAQFDREIGLKID